MDVPIPKTDMVMYLVPRDHIVSRCEVQTFTNAHQSKRMEVHTWSMKYWGHSSRVTTHILLCRLTNV
ncbi:hypothetical protein AAVH_18419 [Aphelenchoides avenae]|nr:hypothetical protein AAVH_18419 [Aphelenchus avenae]